MQISDTLSVSSIGAFLYTNWHDGQTGLVAPFSRARTLVNLIYWASLGWPDSPFTNCCYNWRPFTRTRGTLVFVIVECVMRVRSSTCRLCAAMKAFFRHKGVGRRPEVVVVLHVVPIRDGTVLDGQSRQAQHSDAQYLHPALGGRHRTHRGGRVRPHEVARVPS